MITHNLNVIIQLAQRIIILNHGQICYDGKRNTVFTDNKFLEAVDLEPPRVVKLCNFLKKLDIISQVNLFSINEIQKHIAKAEKSR